MEDGISYYESRGARALLAKALNQQGVHVPEDDWVGITKVTADEVAGEFGENDTAFTLPRSKVHGLVELDLRSLYSAFQHKHMDHLLTGEQIDAFDRVYVFSVEELAIAQRGLCIGFHPLGNATSAVR